MKRYIFLTLAIILGVIACDSGPRSPVGFRLPGGDVESGQAAFVELHCFNCHTVAEVDLPSPGQDLVRPVALGGQVYEVRTDGYLMTSIIHPSHRLASGNRKAEVSTGEGESLMPSQGEIMTVDQLIDLVAFLQSTYEVIPPPRPMF
jgi:sulfur-oxidizing protein SoxX